MMRQLKYKILWFILPVIVIPLGVAGFVSEQTSSEKLTANARTNLQTIAQGVIKTLDDGFARARQDRKVIAGSPEIQTYLAQLEFGLEREAESSLANIQRFLDEFYKISNAYLLIRLIGEDGRTLAQAGRTKKSIDDADFFARFTSVKFGQEANKMSRVRYLPGLSEPVISLGVLVHGTFKEDGADRYDQWAVLILDMDWSRVVRFLNSLKTGRSILVGSQGRLLSHPQVERIVRENLTDSPLVRRTLESPPGSVVSGRIVDDGVEYYTVAQPFAPDEHRKWALLLQVPTKVVLAQAVQMRNLIITVSIVCVIAAIIGILIAAGYITRPVKTLAEATEKVARGDLTARVSIESKDELGHLSAAFNKMAEDLVVYIEELKRTTAENERLAGELEFAARLQDSIIPKEAPELKNFTVAGLSLPARETGGDFFDYLTINGRFDLTLADVSGKGLPAALFMLLSRSTLRTLASEGLPPAQVLTLANALIERDSGASGMFVTTFFASLETATGVFCYANGGHNPPILLRADGGVEELRPTGLALGLTPDNPCGEERVTLNPGDVLVLYTDGVTEAINPAKEEFGVERLIAAIKENRDLPPAQLIGRLKETVFEFAGDEPQFDDFTLTVIRAEPQA